MRPIDADEFKKLLLKERDSIPKLIFDRYDFGVGRRNHDGDLIRAGIRKALRCMEQTPTIEVEPVKHGRWISVEDGLPGEEFLDKEIILCKLNRFGGQLVYVSRFWGTHSALWNDITHWMPLPEPPKMEETT